MRSILFNGMDGIGAFVYYQPLLKALKTVFPSVRITMTCWQMVRDLATASPYIDRVLIYEDLCTPEAGAEDLYRAIFKHGPYDLCIDFGNPPICLYVTRIANASQSIGLRRDIDEENGLYTHLIDLDSQNHICDQYFRAISITGNEMVRPPLELWISEADQALASERFLSLEQFAPGKFVIGICPGAGSVGKRWGKENFIRLIDDLNVLYDVEMVLLGSNRVRVSEADKTDASEVDLCRAIQNKVQGKKPLNLAGKDTIGQLAVILNRCDLVIANDGGPMHLAAALARPVVGIFGPVDPRIWGPLGKHCRVAREEINCGPCGPAGCEDPLCLKMLPATALLSSIDSLDLSIPRVRSPEISAHRHRHKHNKYKDLQKIEDF